MNTENKQDMEKLISYMLEVTAKQETLLSAKDYFGDGTRWPTLKIGAAQVALETLTELLSPELKAKLSA